MRSLDSILEIYIIYNILFDYFPNEDIEQITFIPKNFNKLEIMYLLHGKLTAKDGHAGRLADILLEASKLVSTAIGCRLYVISIDENDLNSVYVTEIWDSKEDHNNSLKVEGVRELITSAIPILGAQPTKGQELEILGGSGITI